jgi:hypothetical protein
MIWSDELSGSWEALPSVHFDEILEMWLMKFLTWRNPWFSSFLSVGIFPNVGYLSVCPIPYTVPL